MMVTPPSQCPKLPQPLIPQSLSHHPQSGQEHQQHQRLELAPLRSLNSNGTRPHPPELELFALGSSSSTPSTRAPLGHANSRLRWQAD